MKRLLEKKTLYHTTTMKNYNKIKIDGFFIPQKSSGAGLTYLDPTNEENNLFQGYVFFSTTINEAKNYLEYFNEDCVILECSIPIKFLLPDKTDCYDCKTWQESEEKNKQVCIKGKLSINYIQKVYLFKK